MFDVGDEVIICTNSVLGRGHMMPVSYFDNLPTIGVVTHRGAILLTVSCVKSGFSQTVYPEQLAPITGSTEKDWQEVVG